MITHVIDAHALVWFVARDPRLGADAKRVLENPDADLLLPAIALAEACWAVGLGRSSIPSPQSLMDVVLKDHRLRVEPLDADIIRVTNDVSMLPLTDMHDRQIVASAIRIMKSGGEVALVTRDRQIVESKLVPIVW